MPYDVGVRQYLQGKGVSSGDIGYDPSSQNVTIRGQNFYKPELNMAGTTYSNQNNLDNAYNNYSKTLPTIQPDGTTAYGTGSSAGGNAGTGVTTVQAPKDVTKPASTGYTNPYTQMIGDLIKHLSDTSNAPQQDIYSTPQYAAAKANQDRMAAESIRHASEAAAGAGLGHSTIMTDRTQRIQNDANQQLATQLVPQIQAQLAQQRQQELNNQENQLRDYMTLGQQADVQNNANRTFEAGRQDAATAATGIYNPTGQSVQDVQAKMDANSAAYAAASPAEKDRLHTENMQLAGLLGKTYDKGTGTYSEGQGFVGTKTIAGRNADLNATQTMAVLTGHLPDGTPTNAAQQQQLQNQWTVAEQTGIIPNSLADFYGLPHGMQTQAAKTQAAQIAVSNRNASNSETSTANAKTNAEQSRLMDVWKATGKAPAGINGVTAGTPYAQAQNTNLKSDKEISDLLDSSPFVTKQLDDNGKIIGTVVSDANKKQMAQYIASLGLPVADAKKWFIRYGLSLTGN